MMALVLLTAVGFALVRELGPIVVIPPAVIAVMAARLAPRRAKRRRLWQALAVLGALSVPLVSAALISKGIWGYYFDRPGLDRRIREVRHVNTVTPVSAEPDGRGGFVFAARPYDPNSPVSFAHVWDHDPYYLLSERVLAALEERGRLPGVLRPMAKHRVSNLYKLVEDTGLLQEGDPGYVEAKKLDGIAVEAVGADGEPLLFLGARGREASNDHYPYYEFLFSGDLDRGDLKLLSTRRFYFDVAGIEGADWRVFFAGTSFAMLLPMTLLTVFVEGARAARAVARRRSQAGPGPALADPQPGSS
jgi:hypothetical protein